MQGRGNRMRAHLKLWAAALAAGLLAGPAAASGAAPADCTGPASSHWLSLTIDNLRNGKGVVILTLYPDDKARFLRPMGSLYVTRVPARAGTSQACIFVPQAGAYALALYHDENDNGRIDRNGLGIPREGFGFSNNPKIVMSAPSLKSVRFVAGPAGTPLRIRMKYP